MSTGSQLFILGFVLFLVVFISLFSTPIGRFVPSYQMILPRPTVYGDVNQPCIPDDKNGFSCIGHSYKVEGFESLHERLEPEDFPQGKEIIDVYSQYKGGLGCPPNPLSNSGGYICMDDKAKQLLMTRGGNQTGGEYRIASPPTKK
jgi:hypothetical protein